MTSGCTSIPKTSVNITSETPAVGNVDMELYHAVLEKVVRDNGSVTFSALRGDTSLTAFLMEVARVRTNVFPSRQSVLALWLNAHNAYVLDLLRNNPARHSPLDISGFRSGDALIVADQHYSLYSIEHDVIGKQFREPRAFFALYMAAKGGPKLSKEPYIDTRVSVQLDSAVKDFLADPAHCKLDRKNNTLYISSFVSEFSEEIERSTGSVLAFIRAFAPEDISNYIGLHPNVHISYTTMDWTLF